MYSKSHCEVIYNILVDQLGVGVWPKCANSYYYTVDVAGTLQGPQAITTNPIYEGAHQFYVTVQGNMAIKFFVSIKFLSCFS